MRPTISFLALLGLSTPALAAWDHPCTFSAACQLGDQAPHGGAVHRPSHQDGPRCADEFRPTSAAHVSAVCWYGGYVDTEGAPARPPEEDAFQITYHVDEAGAPGAVVGGPFPVLASRLATGKDLDPGRGFLLQYRFDGAHPPVAMEPGVTYWISVVGESDPSAVFTWTTSGQGDGHCVAIEGDVTSHLEGGFAFCLDVPFRVAGAPVGERFCRQEGGRLTGRGSEFVYENDLVLIADRMPFHRPALLLASREEGSRPIGNGTLCLGDPLGRFSDQLVSTGGGGHAWFEIDLDHLPAPLGAALRGERFGFQVWYGAGSRGEAAGVTAGLQVTFTD